MSIRDSSAVASPAFDSIDGIYRVTHDEERKSLSTTVVLALCDVAGIDPTGFQLYTYVDPESLDTLFSPLDDAGHERGRVEIVALDYRISIYSSGEIEIRPVGPETPRISD